MSLEDLLEYLDGNGIIVVDLDEIEEALDDVGLNLDSEVK